MLLFSFDISSLIIRVAYC